MANKPHNITGKPLTCDHVLTYEWKRQPDGTETETLKCHYCGSYVVDSEVMQRLRGFAWNTPFTDDDEDDVNE